MAADCVHHVALSRPAMGRSKHSVDCTMEAQASMGQWSRMAVTSCAWCLKRGSESKNREEKPVHVSQSQPRDGRKGPRAGNIVNSSKSAWPPWAMGTTGYTSPQSPSTAFKASVLHVSHSFPHAGPGGRRIREGCAHCRRPQGEVGAWSRPAMGCSKQSVDCTMKASAAMGQGKSMSHAGTGVEWL